MTDIVDRLRYHFQIEQHVSVTETMAEAADEIEQLRMALKTLINFYDDGEIPTAQVLARAEALLG